MLWQRSRLQPAIVIAAAPAVAGAWVADAKSGCQVWNPNPQLEETVAWSGSCANGRAEGHGTVRWVEGRRNERNRRRRVARRPSDRQGHAILGNRTV